MPKFKFSYEDYQKMMQDKIDEHNRQVATRRMPQMPLAEKIRQSAMRIQMPKV